MKSGRLVTGGLVGVVMMLMAGNASAGFSDLPDTKSATVNVASQNAVASADDDAAGEVLTFDTKKDHPPMDEQVQQPQDSQAEPKATQDGATAPLPAALVPGGLMLAGSFIATRVFKRRLV